MNIVVLSGRLGADPETRTTPNGAVVVNMRMATTSYWMKGGERQERTDWHRLEAYGKLAEEVAKYLSKGDKATVQGELRTDTWEDRSGAKKSRVYVYVRSADFLKAAVRKVEPTQNGGAKGQDSAKQSEETDELPF